MTGALSEPFHLGSRNVICTLFEQSPPIIIIYHEHLVAAKTMFKVHITESHLVAPP